MPFDPIILCVLVAAAAFRARFWIGRRLRHWLR